jgi:hypothetical protein
VIVKPAGFAVRVRGQEDVEAQTVAELEALL